jgi:serine protease Do
MQRTDGMSMGHKRIRTILAIVDTATFVTLFLFILETQVHAQSRNNKLELGQLSESLQDLSSRISPSVVQIFGTGFGLQNDEQYAGASVLSRQRSTGSGVIVSDDGYIITNAHVVEAARSIRVRVNGRRNGQTSLFDANLIGLDRLLDLALLRIDSNGLTPLPFGDSLRLKQGELVLAFGSPLSMDNSVSMGIVSAVARQLTEDDPRIFVQTDAPINPGNSGGPLVDAAGRLVGINTFILSQSGGSEGIGFAIPSNVVRYVYASLRKDGHVHRGQIGIFARTLTPSLASAFKLEPENGVLVEDVIPEGPSDNAGIKVGDVVLSLDGKELRNVRDLALQLYQYAIGDTVRLQILRDEKKSEVNVAVTEKRGDPERFADMVNPVDNLISTLGVLGMTVDDGIRKILPPLRYSDGVLVAAHSGQSTYFGDQPQEGDVIHAVNGQRVFSVETLRSELNNLKLADSIVLQVERDGSLMFLVLENN